MSELQQREDNTALCQFPGTNGSTGSKIINILLRLKSLSLCCQVEWKWICWPLWPQLRL